MNIGFGLQSIQDIYREKMPSYIVLGGISHERAKAEFEWKISDLLYYSTYTDGNWDSPSFNFLGVEWCLRINQNVDGIWKGLYLVVRNPSSCYSVTFTLVIRHLRVPCQYGPETRTFDGTNAYHGSVKMFRKNDLARSNTQDASLVIYCAVAQGISSTATACQSTLFNSTTILCRNFQDLLLSGRKSDLTIVVRGEEIEAHKVVLEARSPVFAAMFEHDMTEKKENVIKVEDCDLDTFQNFLQCIYSGIVENLTVDKAIRLYMVSHKYSVTDIMEKCVQFMEEEMGEDTICDILALANRYNETKLKKTAKEFLIWNINGIITNNWSSLIAENSLLQKYS